MDLKLSGYAVSAVSIILLAIVAWPGPGEAQWKAWAVALGVATAIGGMLIRWLSHRRDRREIHRVEAKIQPNVAIRRISDDQPTRSAA